MFLDDIGSKFRIDMLLFDHDFYFLNSVSQKLPEINCFY